MINICTITDKNYLIKTVALYLSLQNTTSKFTLWVLCIDSSSLKLLTKLGLTNLMLIKLREIEDAELKALKKQRTHREYAWTLKSSFISYLLENKKRLSSLIYTDSDMAFFGDAAQIVKECRRNSVGITSHNFSKPYKLKEKTVGKYNSGIVYFKNDNIGRAVARDWKEKCIEYCRYHVTEKGVGDQIYLTDWLTDFKKVVEIHHRGINLAPWSVENYKIKFKTKSVWIGRDRLICYHFHGFKAHPQNKFTYSFGYKLNKEAKELIYVPYEEITKNAISLIHQLDKNFIYGIEDKLWWVGAVNAIYKYIAPFYSKFVSVTGFQYKVYNN